MRQLTDRVKPMARRTWTPDNATAEQKAAIKELDRALTNAEKAKERVQAAIKAAKEVGVPARFLAAHMDQGRATLYRKLGSGKGGAE